MKKISLYFLISVLAFFSKSEAYELGIASFFNNTAPYLKEWIEYHKMVGVDHFWLYNDASTDNWKEVLKPYIKEGVVEVFYWPKKRKTWFVEQRAALADGIRRARETKTTWIALIDQDEFILPMGEEKSVTECLNTHFKSAAAVYINWRHFGTSGVTLKKGEPMLTYLTSCSLINHSRNGSGKSICRPECLTGAVTFVHHFRLKEGTYVNGDGENIPLNNGTPKLRGRHYKYIRINHYPFRDERYYKEVRLPRDISMGHERQTTSAYKDFNLDEDFHVLNFIKKNYPQQYNNFWKPHKK